MYFVMSMRCVFIIKIILKPCKTNPILGILFKSFKICKRYGKFCSKMLEEGWKARRTQKSNNVNKFIFWVEGNTITSTQSKKTMTSFVFSKWTVHPHLDHGNSTSLPDGHAPSRSTEKRAIHSQRWRSKLIWDHQFEPRKMSSNIQMWT